MILDLKKHLPAIAGLTAITLWSLLPALSLYSNDIPPFLKIGLALIFSSIGYITYWAFKYKGNVIQHINLPRSYVVFCVLGLFGNNLSFVESMYMGGGVEGYITMNAWPICTLLLTALFWKEKLTRLDYIGSALGICGVLLIGMKNETSSIIPAPNHGLLLAILNCLIWSIFSTFNRRFGHIASDAIGVPLFIIAILSLLCHFAFEETVIPSTKELLTIAFLGLGPWGLSYALWGFALSRTDNVKSLFNYGFLGPALGLTWMVTLGYANFSTKILIAFLCIITGSFLSSNSKR